MSETLRTRDYRFICLCALVCAASLFVGLRYFQRAFPEASIDFRVDRDSSKAVALNFLREQGISTDGYLQASTFRYDDETKVFLERELGLERTNTLVTGPVKLWRWGHRWFRPLDKEEIRAEVTPGGKLASFSHALPEDAPGADLPVDAARGVAESFLVLEMRRSLESLEFVDSQTEKRPHRTDHVFNWKLPAVHLGAGSYRVAVTVHGDRVDGYDEYVRVPEQWSRGYARLRSLNETTSLIDVVLLALVGVAMLVAIGRRIRIKDVRWKAGLAFGGICAGLQFLASLNEFPLQKYRFETNSSYAGFLTQTILAAVLTAIAFGGVISILTAAAEPEYRQAFPGQLSIRRMFSWRSIRTRSFFIASLAGITLTFFFFAYEIGFYLLANRLGAWAPAEVPYTDLLNTRFPWIFVLLGGFFPAVSEEWVFRAFSIPWLSRLWGRRWLAVAVASFVWGFGHAGYPNQPFFIRGLEVGIVGLVLSWAMFRFGIVAPLIAHYSIDAFYSAFLLLRSGNAYLVGSGAVTAGLNLIPLFLAAAAYIVTRRFEPEAPVINAADPRQVTSRMPDITPEPVPVRTTYSELSRKAVIGAVIVLAAGVLLQTIRTPRFGARIRFAKSATDAAEAAKDFLSGMKFDLAGYDEVTMPSSRIDGPAAQYLYSTGGLTALNGVYGGQVCPVVWQSRFFKPLEKQEYLVNVDPSSGKVVGFRRLLDEDAPGPDLPAPKAQQIAAAFLTHQGYDLRRQELKETTSEKPRQRRDTTFDWEEHPGTTGAAREARVRLEVGVQGGTVGAWTQFVKVPEQWIRERDRVGACRMAAIAGRAAFCLWMFGLALLYLIRGTRRGTINWRLAAKIAGVAIGIELVAVVNSIPAMLFQYDTQIDMRTYALTAMVGALLTLIGIGLAAAFAVGLAVGCYPDAPAALLSRPRLSWGRDAVAAAAACLGAALVVEWMAGQITARAHTLALAPALPIPNGIGSYIPLLAMLRDLFLSTLFFTAVLAFAVKLWTETHARWKRWLIVAGLLASFLPTNAEHATEAALDLIPAVLLIGSAFVVIKLLTRDNYLAYLVCTAVFTTFRLAHLLMAQDNPALFVQGSLVIGLTLAALLSLVVLYPRAAARQFASPAS
jgi:membrane protease YdiL (CAAX protease family)